MSLFVKIALILFGLAYLISPVDLIPDILIPYLGWLDDGLVLWCIYYLLRYKQLPWFLFKKRHSPEQSRPRPGTVRPGKGKTNQAHSEKKQEKFTAKAVEPEYEILGLSPDATWKEIQTAYKERIKKYHPDKLNHLGEEFADLANEKFLEIQQAYESLKRKKGK